MKKSLLLILLTVLLVGCTTSRSTVLNSADLPKYKYATLIGMMSYQGPVTLGDFEIKLFNAIESSRLQMISENRLGTLTPAQKNALLTVRYAITQQDDETVITINFIDYMTGKPIASCRGAYGWGMDKESDFNGAMERVARQIQNTFPR